MKMALRLKWLLITLLLSLSLLATAAQAQLLAPDEDEGKPQRYTALQAPTMGEAMNDFNSGDMTAAVKDFWRLAPEGDPQAQFYLAYMLDAGLGTSKDMFGAVS